LLGVTISTATVSPGGAIRLKLYWKIDAAIGDDLTAFVHLQRAEAEDQAPAAQADRRPCGDTYPSIDWQPGEVIAYPVTILLPSGIEPGQYLVSVGWYDTATGQRARLMSAAEPLPDNRATVGHITVTDGN
jgi:hypothetical protein